MLYLEENVRLTVWYQFYINFFIPSLRKVEEKEGNCFFIRIPQICVEGRLMLLCMYIFATLKHTYNFLHCLFPVASTFFEHNYSQIFPSKNCRNFPFWLVFRLSYNTVIGRGWADEQYQHRWCYLLVHLSALQILLQSRIFQRRFHSYRATLKCHA